MKVHLDFETSCDLDLKRVGLRNYVAHQTFRITLTALAVDDEPVHLQWEGFPDEACEILVRADEVHAFNAPFERTVLRKYWVELPVERWRCTMAHAYTRAFTGGLADVGKQLGLPQDKQKLSNSTRLITHFCHTGQPRTWTPADHPAQWEAFKEYNRQDVVAEREIARRLAAYPMTRDELDLMWWDWSVNDRGLPVDMTLVGNAVRIAERKAKDLNSQIRDLTGVLPTSGPQLLAWCHNQGAVGLENLQAATIDAYLEDPMQLPVVAEVLSLRRQASQAATKKFANVAETAHRERLHDTLQYCGASRTGRWSGRGFQLQNLKRSPKQCREWADQLASDPEGFAAERSLEDLGGLARSVISAPPGEALVVSDLSSIESRVLGRLSGCQWINDVFAQGRDTYRAFAEMWLGVPYDDVDKATRNLCKPPFLGFGFGIGAVGLKKYADSMGVEMTEEQCDSAIRVARTRCWEVPRLWKTLENAARSAVVLGESVELPEQRVAFRYDGLFLTMELPSGRNLYYYDPKIDEDGSLTYMGQDQYTRQWVELRTWGGKLVENAVQAIARDILAGGMLRYEKQGGVVVGHVHDEVIATAPLAGGGAILSLARLNQALSVAPAWAPGLLLGAEGFIARRYRKG